MSDVGPENSAYEEKTSQDLHAHNILTRSVTDINDPQIVQAISNDDDLQYIISVSAPQIFKPELLSLRNKTFMNIHCAKLPSYRGMMPNFWQKLESQKISSITLHEMQPTLDTGKTISDFSFPLLLSESLHETMKRTKRYSAHLLFNYLESNNLANRPESVPSRNYYSFPGREHRISFKQQRGRFL